MSVVEATHSVVFCNGSPSKLIQEISNRFYHLLRNSRVEELMQLYDVYNLFSNLDLIFKKWWVKLDFRFPRVVCAEYT